MTDTTMTEPSEAPAPRPPIAAPHTGLTTSIDVVLRHVLQRVDARRATPASVRAALAAAGIQATEAWCLDWLQRAAEIREEHTR